MLHERDLLRSARQLIFIEKDGEFPEFPMYLSGSGLLVTINGVIAIITARHCLINEINRQGRMGKRILATLRQVGVQNKYAMFKNLYYVHDIDSSANLIGGECDLAVGISDDSDNITTDDAIPVFSHQGSLFDNFNGIGQEYVAYGFPEISGSLLIDKTILHNPVTITLKFNSQDGINVKCDIIEIIDLLNRSYPITSALAGMSGGPVFRKDRTNGTMKFSGIVVMGSNAIIRFLPSSHIIRFIKSACLK